jgi:hypothetical protein
VIHFRHVGCKTKNKRTVYCDIHKLVIHSIYQEQHTCRIVYSWNQTQNKTYKKINKRAAENIARNRCQMKCVDVEAEARLSYKPFVVNNTNLSVEKPKNKKQKYQSNKMYNEWKVSPHHCQRWWLIFFIGFHTLHDSFQSIHTGFCAMYCQVIGNFAEHYRELQAISYTTQGSRNTYEWAPPS